MKRPHASPRRNSSKVDWCPRCRFWHDPRKTCVSGEQMWRNSMEILQERRENRLAEPRAFNSRFVRANPGLFKSGKWKT
jgi:hypothetical protein